MEYLMTYGWAILIIAIVMVALFELGIFNAQEPRVYAGACEVYHGNDVGECQGVWPQFVAQFDPSPAAMSTGYGISNVYVSIPNMQVAPTGTDNALLTITAWVNMQNYGACSGYCVIPIVTLENQYYAFGIAAGAGLGIHGCGSPDVEVSMPPFNENTWNFIAMSYNPISNEYYFQQNSYSATSSNRGYDSTAGGVLIGSQNACNGATFQGEISNVQVYNTSLSQAEITALYQEGIGGAPIDPTHIVGWWPLNGNAQDYSGNGNDGQATGVSYTSTWTSGYTSP